MRHSEAATARDAVYRTVWRWHFYAGLIVLPVLAWLAGTGALYLYKPEIEAIVYGQWSHVEPRREMPPLDTLIARIEAQSGAKVAQVTRPADPHTSWRMTLKQPNGTRLMAFVDPYRGQLLGTTGDGGIMQTVRSLHSLIITGPIGNAMVEIVAGWAAILVASGVYLWWPRRGHPRSPCGAARKPGCSGEIFMHPSGWSREA